MFKYTCWTKALNDKDEPAGYYVENGNILLDVANVETAKKILEEEFGYCEEEGDLITEDKVEV